MANIHIAIMNQSTVVDEHETELATAVLQKQVDHDFAPIWGIPAELRYVASAHDAHPSEWQLMILDDADQADALGYHDLTDTGMPLMKVFAKTSMSDNVSWSSVASHELLEALADPYVDSTVFVEHGANGRIWPLEICDPVEGDTYHIDAVEVSNFVTPDWFRANAPTGAVFDYLGLAQKPFEVRPNGYMEYYDVTGGSGWKQINAELHPDLRN